MYIVELEWGHSWQLTVRFTLIRIFPVKCLGWSAKADASNPVNLKSKRTKLIWRRCKKERKNRLHACNLFTMERIINNIIIGYKLFSPFAGQELTTWPANNCLQIVGCSCTMSFNYVWLYIIFCSGINETTLFSFLRLHWWPNDKTNYWTQLLQNNIVICQCLADQLLASAE